jgi:hypothetical protein
MYYNNIEEEEGMLVQNSIPSYFEEMEEVKVRYHLIEETANEAIETE